MGRDLVQLRGLNEKGPRCAAPEGHRINEPSCADSTPVQIVRVVMSTPHFFSFGRIKRGSESNFDAFLNGSSSCIA